jgi:hypothetical protein
VAEVVFLLGAAAGFISGLWLGYRRGLRDSLRALEQANAAAELVLREGPHLEALAEAMGNGDWDRASALVATRQPQTEEDQ